MKKLICIVLVLVISQTIVSAQEESDHGISYSLSVGGLAPILANSGDVPGMYIYAGPSLLIPVTQKIAVISGIGYEVMPEKGNHGLVVSLTCDYLMTDWLGFDLGVIATHDEDKTLEDILGRGRTYFISLGIGVSWLLPNGMAVSPMVTRDFSLDHLGDSYSPTILLSVPIP